MSAHGSEPRRLARRVTIWHLLPVLLAATYVVLFATRRLDPRELADHLRTPLLIALAFTAYAFALLVSPFVGFIWRY